MWKYSVKVGTGKGWEKKGEEFGELKGERVDSIWYSEFATMRNIIKAQWDERNSSNVFAAAKNETITQWMLAKRDEKMGKRYKYGETIDKREARLESKHMRDGISDPHSSRI